MSPHSQPALGAVSSRANLIAHTFFRWSAFHFPGSFCFLLALSIIPRAIGSTFYVAPNGADLNPGTQAAPWRTMQKAANSMKAGDTTLVANGSYPEMVTSKNAGLKGAPITFQALSGNAVAFGFIISHPYQVIKGFTLNGTGVSALQGTVTVKSGGDSLLVSGVCFDSSPSNAYQFLVTPKLNVTNIVLTRNQFLNGNFQSVFFCGRNCTISSNLFSSPNGWDALDLFCSDSVVQGNNFINWSNLVGNPNHTDLFQSYDDHGEISKNVVIEGNFAYNCEHAQIGNLHDIHNGNNISDYTFRNNIFLNVGKVMSLSAPRMSFYNNVFYNCGQNGVGPIMFRNLPGFAPSNDSKMVNNIFVSCGINPGANNQGWYSVDSGVTGFSADYNLVVGTGAGTTKSTFKTGGLEVHGINGLDPQFLNPAMMNFRLKAASPALGTGADLSGFFTTEFTGGQRVGPWSRGAY